jgi:hypothetical protein
MALARAAASQAGVVSRSQVAEAGLGDGVIAARLQGGRWQRLLPGIYATFSGPAPRAALRWAAVLYAGPGALLSHETAAELWALCDETDGPVHVSVPHSRRPKRQPGMVVHRSTHAVGAGHPARLPPVTRVEETVLDLTQAACSIDQAFAWLTSACGRRLTTPDRLLAALYQRRQARWRAAIAAALRDVAAGCHSVLELRYLRQVERAHGLPAGTRQTTRASRPSTGTARRRRRYDDVRYERWGLVVELDGRAAHPDEARHRDRDRDNHTVVEGAAVLRYGWGDVTERPCSVAGDVATLLHRAGWPGRPHPCSTRCTATEPSALARPGPRRPSPSGGRASGGRPSAGGATLGSSAS